MPKDRKARSSSFDRCGASPYPLNSKNSNTCQSKNPSVQAGDEKEWEEARCPICMEHSHNAVLLLCSSHNKGCRPFMCNTSKRHSNCLDQFHRSCTAKSSEGLPNEVSLFHTAHQRERQEWHLGSDHGRTSSLHGRERPELVCPLCRGYIIRSIVIEPARRFMNSKPRSCSLETCNFSGTYPELRRHARIEHPTFRPSQADPRRKREWIRLEREMEFQDVFSVLDSNFGDNSSEDEIFNDDHDWAWLQSDEDLEGLSSSSECEAEFSDSSESEAEFSEDGIVGAGFDLELPLSFAYDLYMRDPLFEMGGSGSSRNRDHLYDNSRSSRRSTTTTSSRTETSGGNGGNSGSLTWRRVGSSGPQSNHLYVSRRSTTTYHTETSTANGGNSGFLLSRGVGSSSGSLTWRREGSSGRGSNS